MEKLTTVRELFRETDKFIDKEVAVGGWVRSVRDSRTFGFMVINDGSCFDTLQIVYHDALSNFAEISKLNVGSSVIVRGTLVATPEASVPLTITDEERWPPEWRPAL